MRETVQEVQRKYEHLKRERQPWEAEWKDVMKYVFPSKSAFRDTKGKPERISESVYDGTAIGARNVAAHGIVGYMMSPGGDWFRLLLSDLGLMEIPGVREYLEGAERILYNDYRRSNFYEEVTEVMKTLVSIGTAGLYVEENIEQDSVAFTAIHPKELFVAENRWHRIDTVLRRTWPTIREVADEFGEKQLSHAAQRALEKNPYERIEILHAVFPREDRDVKKVNAESKRFASMYIEVGSDSEKPLRQSGYDIMPYVVPRLSKDSDQVYGKGFGSDALSEIKTANAMGRDLLDAAHLTVNPPLNVPKTMRNRLQIKPWGKNYYEQGDMQVTPMQLGQNFPIGLDRQQDVREIIEEKFLVRFFLMLQYAPDGMTATEVVERQSEKAAVLGPMIQRISSDFLDPIMDLVFMLSAKAGRIQEPPPALLRASRGRVEVDYIGPLAQAQKRFYKTRGITQALSGFLPLLQVKPELVDLIDWDQMAREQLEANGMPASVVRDEEQLKLARQLRAQAMQQAQQQAQLQQAADVYPKLNEPVQEGSPIAGMAEQTRQALQGGAP